MDAGVGTGVGVVFSGQGSQRAAMGEPWRHVEAWSLVELISGVTGEDVADLLLRADDETLRRTDRAQIATFALEIVINEHFTRTDPRASTVAAFAGHSLGEYAALVAAGIVELDAAAHLVAARGAAMLTAAEAEPGTMVAVMGAALEDVEAALAPLAAAGTNVWVANMNAPDQTVLAGDRDGIEQATATLRGVGKVLTLPVGGAFHSPLMGTAEAPLRAALAATAFADAPGPVVANVDAVAHAGGAAWIDLLTRQLTAPVRWTDCIRTMIEECGCATFVEIGPGNTLSNLLKRIDRSVSASRVTAPERDPRLAAGG